MSEGLGLLAAAPQESGHRGADYLDVADLRDIFRCGESKARLIMDLLPHTRIGRRYYVLRSDLYDYMQTHDSIDLAWPKKRR